MLLQVHDELVFEAPAEEAEATCALAKRGDGAGRRPGRGALVPLVVDARAAPNWDEAHLRAINPIPATLPVTPSAGHRHRSRSGSLMAHAEAPWPRRR